MNHSGNSYRVVLSNTAGTGSAFKGNGSVARLYNGSTLLNTYTLGQLGAGDGYLSFAANPWNGSWNLAHIDNLQISVTDTPQGFASWLGSYGLSAAPHDDSDGDSISNLIEYIIGGNPANQPDASLLPTVELKSADLDGAPGNENYLLFTYCRTKLANADAALTLRAEWTTDLAPPWTAADGTHGEVIQIQDSGDFDLVKVHIPESLAPGGKLFARLRASINLP